LRRERDGEVLPVGGEGGVREGIPELGAAEGTAANGGTMRNQNWRSAKISEGLWGLEEIRRRDETRE